VLLAMGIGLPLMGYMISLGGDRDALYPLIGVGLLLFLMGAALLLVWWIGQRQSGPPPDQPKA
jgi:hypothetical protein